MGNAARDASLLKQRGDWERKRVDNNKSIDEMAVFNVAVNLK